MRYRVRRRDFCEPNITLPTMESAIAYVDSQDGDHSRINRFNDMPKEHNDDWYRRIKKNDQR